MEKNFHDSEFGVQELADALGMNRSVLSKKLNAETGLPTSQFIRNYRLDIAEKMITDNVANRNITEIAYRVGFNDPKYFTRCFTKQYGMAPSEFQGGDFVKYKVLAFRFLEGDSVRLRLFIEEEFLCLRLFFREKNGSRVSVVHLLFPFVHLRLLCN